jgi:hypothetical protein
MQKVSNWWKNFTSPEQEQRDLISDKRKNIIKSLRDNLTTTESIDLFEDIEALFRLKMAERLAQVVQEKEKLEEFLSI